MKRSATITFVLLLGLSCMPARGTAQLFHQDFSNSFGPLLGTSGTSTTPLYLIDPNYINATPSNSQFNYICAYGNSASQYMSIGASGGVLTMDRVSAGNGALIRNTPFPGPPTSLLVKFDFNFTRYGGSGSSSGNYVNFNVGTSFDTGAGRPSGGYAKFGIGFFRNSGVDSGWYVNNINSGIAPGPGKFNGSKTITFAVNNSGGQLTYTAPDGSSETVADKMWDLWVGTSKEFDEQPANSDTNKLIAFKIVYGGQSGTVVIDNLLIEPLVATGVETTAGLPRATMLNQNYPNPFNPSTTIRYELAGGGGNVRLAVYDLIGREVAVLVNGPKSPGRYEVMLNGSDLASGVYLYRLTAGGYAETRKLVILR